MSAHHHHDHNAPVADGNENELERLLQLAASEPAYRPAFCRCLLQATVYIPGDGEQGDAVINVETPVNIQLWEKPDGGSVVPFFSSPAMLRQASADGHSCIAIPARRLFEITQGATLFLNPQAEYGKEFFPDEVAMLLATGGVAKPTERYIEQETQILLGQPVEYPAAMVAALTRLFSQRKSIRRAFLALMHDQSVDPRPNLLIGLEVDDEQADIEKLISEAGSVASETAPNDDPVDFCLVSEQERGVSHYLLAHTQPFYQRRWGSWLRDMIPAQ